AIGKLEGNTELLCDVLYACCKPDAERQGISEEEFGTGLRGDVIANATQALLEDLVSFIQNPRMRAALQRVLQAATTVVDRQLDRMEKRLDKVLPELVERAASGPTSGEPQELSA
ncbi:MAG: hypothetical protein JNK53_00995, partial [Phycisphaerae bacterium]|nr:hypothetical protein [Phycisphaerae bacterium]